MSTEEKKVKESSGGQGFISLPDEGKPYSALGTEWKLVATSGDTSGACEVIEAVFPPQGGFPPHYHHFDEGIYFLEGSMTLVVGDRTVKASAGTFTFVPRGMVHSWLNESSTPCKVLIWFMPSFGPGIEGALEELSQWSQGEPDMAKLSAIFQK